MQIVTDSGTDLWLGPEQAAELDIHIVPLVVTLDGKSYREGVDIQPEEFYRLLAATDSLPSRRSHRRGSLPRHIDGWQSRTQTYCPYI